MANSMLWSMVEQSIYSHWSQDYANYFGGKQGEPSQLFTKYE
jgi:hypothetical protein